MAKDRLGNELNEGDLVQLTLDGPVVYGKVAKITEGGVVVPGGQRLGKHEQQQIITAGQVTVVLEGAAQFDPRDGRAPGIVKVVDPEIRTRALSALRPPHGLV